MRETSKRGGCLYPDASGRKSRGARVGEKPVSFLQGLHSRLRELWATRTTDRHGTRDLPISSRISCTGGDRDKGRPLPKLQFISSKRCNGVRSNAGKSDHSWSGQ